MSTKKHLTGVITTVWTEAQQKQALIDRVIEFIWGKKK